MSDLLPTPSGPIYRFAADVGGTFTDIACLAHDARLSTRKLPTTPDDFSRAVIEGIVSLGAELGVSGDRIDEVLHASTIATNAILEGKGARTALVTTRGFRDVLEMRRIRVPRLYEPLYVKPAPLVPRRWRFEVKERMGPRGEVIERLDLEGIEQLAAELDSAGIEAIAVCFLHSYANPAHEIAFAAALRAALPGRFVSVSCEVLPEIREYERTSTTVVNAYIGPVIAGYLDRLQRQLREAGIPARLLMMQSSGGTLSVDHVIARPATVVESGPAAGVVGAARFASACGLGDLITFDMGGTTAKASMVENGEVATTAEYEVGGGISLSSRMVKGGGYALKLPVIDVSEVGAGGGSIVRIDAGGALKVGPDSAGARPGPACYAAGGTQPTVTDANVVLGYLNPQVLAGGAVRIDSELSRAALRPMADAVGLGLLEVAHGVHMLANATMMRAVKAVSTYRGRDPRDFTLFAFGGNGGIHAASLARELGMKRVVVPPGAGVFSAVGLLVADFEVSRSLACRRELSVDTVDEFAAALARTEAEVMAEAGPGASIRRRAELCYRGQGFELGVTIPPGRFCEGAIHDLRAAFEAEHRRSYGYVLEDRAVDFVGIRVSALLPPRGAARIGAIDGGPVERPAPRSVYFGGALGPIQTAVIGRADLPPEGLAGPLVIEEHEGTTIVPPGARAHRDCHGNIVIELED